MTPQRAVGYVRISDDREGEEAGVSRQQQDIAKLAERLEWNVTEVVVENDTSAWKRRKVVLPDGSTGMRVVRPGFRRLLDMLAHGVADGFVAYDLDRVARDPRDLEDLIDVVVMSKVPTQSVTGSLDLSTDSGILAARINVAVAHKSSADTSRRVRRKHEELAQTGKYAGGGLRPFGYERDGVTVRDAEADWVQWMCARALGYPHWDAYVWDTYLGERVSEQGVSLSRIGRELDQHGVKPPQGGEKWNARSVYTILTGPRIAGLRRFRGEIIGKAHWSALVDQDTFDRVQSALASRRGNSGNTLTWWCVGLLWCSKCGRQLVSVKAASSASSRGRPRKAYRCPCLKLIISPAEEVEAEIRRQVLDFLTQPDVLTRLRTTTSPAAAEQARLDVADDERQLAELATAYGTKKLTMAEWLAAREPIEVRLRDARNVLSLAAPGTLRRILAGDVTAGFDGLDARGKREVALTVQPRGWRVDPLPPGARSRFDPARLVPIHDEA